MDKDEDIDILDPSEGHQNSESPPFFVIKSGTDENPQASHHALFQAYEEMKRRQQQLKYQNDSLKQTIVEMEYSRQGNRTNSNMFGAAGPVGASPAGAEDHSAQVKAQIGYAESVQRQLMRAQAKIISLENECKELRNRFINNKNSSATDPTTLQQKINEVNAKNLQLTEKITSLNRDTQTFKTLLNEKDVKIQQLEKQKDPAIQTEPFTRKIQELKNEIREKDEHIVALMERLKTISAKGGYDNKIMNMDRDWMPESGYNTRMNEDQQLLTVDESKQILFEIEKHKKTLKHFLHQLKSQTEIIQKQGQIILELKRRSASVLSPKRQTEHVEGDISLTNREPSPTWRTIADRSKQSSMGTGARPKDSSYTLNNVGLFNENVISKANSSPVLSPSDDSANTMNHGDTLFGQGVKNEFSRSFNFMPLSVDNNPSRNYIGSDVGSKFSPSILVSRQSVENSPSVYTEVNNPGIKESTAVIESNHVADNNSGRKTTAQICPVCSKEFPNMTMEDFQQHVFECIDDGDDEPLHTLQNPSVGDSNGMDRSCPMCNKSFANTLPLADFEKHVQDHFNEEPIVDRFEVLRP